MSKPSSKLSLDKKHNLTGWAFLTPAALLILFMNFLRMFKALILASILNNRHLRCKGLFRTMIFLPCETSLVAYATIFRSLFANGYSGICSDESG